MAFLSNMLSGQQPQPASQNPYAEQPGLIGALFGIGDNPIYKAARPALQDISLGLQGGDVQAARNGRAQQRALAAGWDQSMQSRQTLAQALAKAGQTDLADAVSSGAIDPSQGFGYLIDTQNKAKADAATTARNRANAAFLQDPALRQMVESGALDFKAAYDMQMKGSTVDPVKLSPGDVLFDPRARQPIYAAPGANGGAGDLSLTPQWVIDPKTGQPTIGQLGKDGKLHPTDLGGYQPVNPYDMAGGKAGATVDAKTAAQARAALPGAEQAAKVANQALDLITGDNKGLSEQFGNILGVPQRNLPVLPGSSLGNWTANFAQAKGQSFLQARQMLKGSGPITDFESAKADAAYSRMEQAAATGDLNNFMMAAQDFRQAVSDGLDKLRATANGAYGAGQPAVTGGSAGGYDPLGILGGQ